MAMDEEARDEAEARREIAECDGTELSLYGLEHLRKLPSELSGLTGLQQLDLSECESLTDLTPLNGLHGLQQLDLSECQSLTDLTPLNGLHGLQQLHLNGCKSLTDLTPLDGLHGLQQLDLSWCESLTDLTPLDELHGLQQLDLRWCESLTDLTPLDGLHGLHGLHGLQQLDLSGCKSLTDLTPLDGLHGLQQLDLSWCESLTDLTLLSSLSDLEYLNLYDCPTVLDCHPNSGQLRHWPRLSRLIVSHVVSAPSDLCSNNYDDNALPRIKAWQTDLLRGEAPQSTVKLFVLGNGGVGKTQLCRRLLGMGFDASVASTHGIVTDELCLAAATADQPEIRANLWDFGGQDVYLGTHALFLDERAIYVLAWTPEYENCNVFEQHGTPMCNRPLRYWLDYVHSLAGSSAPVIVVQTQCDRHDAVRSAPLPDEPRFEYLKTTECSALADDGMARLHLELQLAARHQVRQYGKVRLPASWVAVAGELRERRAERTLSLATFDRLCKDAHGTSSPAAVRGYLHRSGQVFWNDKAFGGDVVLDLQWALAGVYAVLERNTALPEIRRSGGYFGLGLLRALVWHDRSERECRLFLGMMQQCRVCFAIAPDQYVAPALLPDEQAASARLESVWQNRMPEAEVHLHHAFLHEGTLRTILCRIGEEAGACAAYWRYGVCFYDSQQKATVKISSRLPDIPAGESGGTIQIEVAGADAPEFAERLVAYVLEIDIGSTPEIRWIRGEPGTDRPGFSETAAEYEQDMKITAATPPTAADQPLPVYVSYAWRGNSVALVDEFQSKLPATEFELRRDKDVNRPGDWLSVFMNEIACADRVLVVLSEEYLKSRYCMRELLGLYNENNRSRAAMMQKIIVIHEGNLGIDDDLVRLGHVEHWHGKHQTLKQKILQLELKGCGNPTFDSYRTIDEFVGFLDEVLHAFSDTIMPRSSAGIDAAIELFRERAAQRRSP